MPLAGRPEGQLGKGGRRERQRRPGYSATARYGTLSLCPRHGLLVVQVCTPSGGVCGLSSSAGVPTLPDPGVVSPHTPPEGTWESRNVCFPFKKGLRLKFLNPL